MAEINWKWLKMDGIISYVWNWLELAENSWKLLEIAGNGWKRLGLLENFGNS